MDNKRGESKLDIGGFLNSLNLAEWRKRGRDEGSPFLLSQTRAKAKWQDFKPAELLARVKQTGDWLYRFQIRRDAPVTGKKIGDLSRV